MAIFDLGDGWEGSTLGGIEVWKSGEGRTAYVGVSFDSSVTGKVYEGPAQRCDFSYLASPPRVVARLRRRPPAEGPSGHLVPLWRAIEWGERHLTGRTPLPEVRERFLELSGGEG
jgi:hypothetical protein